METKLTWAATYLACLWLAMVAFSGCKTATKLPPCVSSCGLLIEDHGNGSLSCDVVQEAEDAVLAAFDELKEQDDRLSKENMCKAMFGWQVKLEEEVIGFDSTVNNGAPFVGLSNCSTRQMFLMANASWRKGSFPHEVVHIAQHCSTPVDWGENHREGVGSGHNGWEEHGVYGIIEDFRKGRR